MNRRALVRLHRGSLGLLLMFAVSACSSVATPAASPTLAAPRTFTGSASASPSPTAPATTVLVGKLTASTLLKRPGDPPGFTFPVFSDGRYAASSLSDGQGVYRLVVLDTATGVVRTLTVPDGAYGGLAGLVNGRVAISSWRPNPGTDLRGYDYAIEDLAATTRTALDRFDIPGRFHSQGAAAAPNALMVLGRSTVAYNHLYVQADRLYAELRAGPIGGPMKVVLTTTAVLSPVAISDTALLYVLQTGAEDAIHFYDLTTAQDRVLLRAPAGATEHALGDNWYLYSTHQNSATTQTGHLVLRNLVTGIETTLATGNCTFPSLNERYAMAGCASDPGRGSMSLTVFELTTLRPVEVARSTEPLAGPRLAPGVIYWVRYAGTPPVTAVFEMLRY